MLAVRDLVVWYGAATALNGVDLTLTQGEIVALVGPNGAGKSTLVNAVCGVIPIASGSVHVDGRVAQVPEGRQMFSDMSVEDNLRLGAWTLRRRDPAAIYEIFPDLLPIRKKKAGALSGGQQQMVAVGRALMAKPDLLVIDELSLGLAPLVVANLAAHLVELNKTAGTTVLLIEQEIALAFRISTRGYVLDTGQIVASGSIAELERDEKVRRAYLGGVTTSTATDERPRTGSTT